jgi:hypothetical protein
MRFEVQKRISSLKTVLTSLSSALNFKGTGILIFLIALAYIVDKSFIDLRDHLRTASSFFALTIALGIILYRRNQLSEFMVLTFILVLMIAPFYWRFQGLDTDGYTLAGFFSQSDANGYFAGALKILYGEETAEFASRRPFFSAFLSVLLFLFNQNFILTLVFLALMTSLAIYFLSREVRETFGVFPATLIIMMVVYSYLGKFHGKFLTEQLGLPLGLLALALLLYGLKEKNLFYLLLATLILSVALNARAGAFFVLPFLILWFLTLKRNTVHSIFTSGSLIFFSAAFGFIVNLWLFSALSAPGSIPFNNFGYTLYGLATGYRGWRAYNLDYPDLPLSEAMPISVDIILNDPSTFLYALVQAYREFFNPVRFFSFLYLPDKELPLLAFVMLLLLILGLFRLIKVRHAPFAQMLFAVIAGILLSVPFAPPIDDGIRAMTVTNPFWALIVGLSFADLSKVRAGSSEEWKLAFPGWNGLLAFSSIMVIAVTLGWLLVRGSIQPAVVASQCGPGESPISLLASPGSYINVVRNSSASRSWYPDLRREDVRKNAKDFAGLYSQDVLNRMEAGQSLLYGLNLADADKDFVWLIAPTDSIQTRNGINSFCGVKTGQPQLDEAAFYIDRSLSKK